MYRYFILLLMSFLLVGCFVWVDEDLDFSITKEEWSTSTSNIGHGYINLELEGTTNAGSLKIMTCGYGVISHEDIVISNGKFTDSITINAYTVIPTSNVTMNTELIAKRKSVMRIFTLSSPELSF